MKHTPRRHISFDFWNTLASPNPGFGATRNTILAEAFDTDTETAKLVYAQLKQCIDGFCQTGQQPPEPLVWDSLAMAMGQATGKETHGVDMAPVREKLKSAFYRFPPKISEQTIKLLYALYEEGYGLSIGSNTVFIPGGVIRDIMRHYYLDKLFQFMLFSDEIGIAKPHPEFFHHIAIGSGCRTINQVLHIGDSQVFDCAGAQHIGMHYLKVQNPDNLIEIIMGKLNG